MNWEKQLIECAKNDLSYLRMLEETRNREQVFLNIRQMLSPEYREAVDRYISACEELDHILTGLAYEVGRETGEKSQVLHQKGRN